MARFVVPVALALVVAIAGCTSAGESAAPASTSAAATTRTPTASPSTAASGAALRPPSSEPSDASSAAATPDPTPSASAAPAEPVGWSPVGAAGPSAREDHTWTVAPDGAAWLFGGRDGSTVFGDLWRYDLATDAWSEAAPTGATPEGRFGHTASWVDGVGLVVWSGQSGPSTFFGDLWAFEPESGAWRELTPDGPAPPARYGSCAALAPDGRLWVSHGFTEDAGRFADTWAFDFAAGQWTELTLDDPAPVIRCLHDCIWTPDGRFLVYAGQTTGAPAIGDLWTRPSDGAWRQAATPEPAPRQLYAIATRGSEAWVFGGGTQDRTKLGDLWRLDLAALTWQQPELPGEAPSPRSGATLVHDATADRLLLFGGLTDAGASGETWAIGFGG